MVLVNYATKEIVAKIVYYGPALCGKTTNLQFIYTKLNPRKRGKMISLATEADRTLFFDFLPMELGVVQGFRVRFQLYTVPGQVFYSATRKLVLKGADAVIFVADSQADVLGKNLESIEDMKTNLMENNLDPYKIPIVFQYNKRDLDRIMEVSELEGKVNFRGTPAFEAVATVGTGVMDSFKEITRMLIQDLKRRHSFMDTDKIKELPPEVFEYKKETPQAEKPQVTYELEIGSGYHQAEADTEVVAGELLDQIEVISLADTIQAEAFFDNVRKGKSAEEAKQKAVMTVGPEEKPDQSVTGKAKVEELFGESWDTPGRVGERQIDPEELAADIVPETAVPAPPPPAQPEEYFLGLDMTAPEMMEPEGVVSAPHEKPAADPAPVEAPQTVQPMDMTPLILAIENLERQVSALRQEVEDLKVAAPPQPAPASDMAGQVEEIKNGIKAASEGQDRLLLSILEAVRESRKGSMDALEKIEDALKYLIDKFRDDVKVTKKKWF